MAQNKTKLGLAYARKTASKIRPCQEDNTRLSMMMCEFEQSPQGSEERPAPAGNIYQAILGEMASEHNNYISTLVVNHSKKKSLKEAKRKSAILAEDDELQYAASARQPISVETLKLDKSQCFSHYGSVEEQQQQLYEEEMTEWVERINSSRPASRPGRSSSRPKFFEQQQSQRSDLSTAQKYQKQQIVTTNFETPRDKGNASQQNSFMEFMDEYLAELNRTHTAGHKNNGPHQTSKDSGRDDAKEQAKLARKIESYEKKFKEMQLSSHMQVVPPVMQVKRLKKKEMALKTKYAELQHHVTLLTEELHRERHQRKRFEQFFGEFRARMNMMKGGSSSGKSSTMEASRLAGSSTDQHFSKYSGSPYEMTSSCDEVLDSFERESSCSSIYGSQDARVVFGPSRHGNLQFQPAKGSMHKKSSNFFRPLKEPTKHLDMDTQNDQLEWA